MGARQRLLWIVYAWLYDSLWDSPLTERTSEEVVRHIADGGSVLEVGAGTGLVARRLQPRCASLTATEPNRFMAQQLHRRMPSLDVIPVALESLPSLPLYDHVVAVNVVHLTDDPMKSVERLQALCRPNGSVVIATPYAEPGVLRVVLALWGMGTGFRFCARFALVHLLLAPLTILAVQRRPHLSLGPPADVVARVTAIHVLGPRAAY